MRDVEIMTRTLPDLLIEPVVRMALAEIERSDAVRGACDCLPVLDDWQPAEPRQEA
jgi:hypothetical protein